MNRTIIYARVSTEDQVEKYGLPTQIRACHEYAKRNGLTVIGEITDDGISGTILDRPGLEKVRQMARAKDVDVVLMLDVDRLSRELSHLLILKPEIDKVARLEFVAAKFEDSPSGRLFFGIRGVIGQYERELTRERTMRGQKERARSGLIVGGRPTYGYRYVEGRLVEDPERAPIARKIFADYEAGASIRGITQSLRASGAPTWRGRQWGKSSVGFILANETYVGMSYFGATRRDDGRLVRRDASERITIEVPSLVSREQWERVQARMMDNPSVGRPSATFLLRGLLYCGSCGRRMSGERDKRWLYYRCGGRDPLASGARCRARANGEAIDFSVWRGLTRTLSDPASLRALVAKQEEAAREVKPEYVEGLRIRARRLRGKEQAAMNLMLDPDMKAELLTFKAQYKEAAEERRKVEAELATMDRQQVDLSWVDETVRQIRDFMLDMSQEMKQQFVRRLVTRAEWDGEMIRMQVFITSESAKTPRGIGQLNSLQVVVNERVAA